jgi:hypothetical protein
LPTLRELKNVSLAFDKLPCTLNAGRPRYHGRPRVHCPSGVEWGREDVLCELRLRIIKESDSEIPSVHEPKAMHPAVT